MLAGMGSKPLEIKGVLKDTSRVYQSLFRRSVVTGFIVFALLGLIELIAEVTHNATVALVFGVLLNVWGRTVVAGTVLYLILGKLSATTGHPILSFWISGALASALVTPYAGHAFSVVYYRLTDPGRPVIAEEHAQAWHSIWREPESTEL